MGEEEAFDDREQTTGAAVAVAELSLVFSTAKITCLPPCTGGLTGWEDGGGGGVVDSPNEPLEDDVELDVEEPSEKLPDCVAPEDVTDSPPSRPCPMRPAVDWC